MVGHQKVGKISKKGGKKLGMPLKGWKDCFVISIIGLDRPTTWKYRDHDCNENEILTSVQAA